MLRFLLSPRRVALHVVVLALVAAMVALGLWQLDRARASGEPRPRAADPPTVPLDTLTVPGQLLPGQAYGRRVSVSGAFDAGHQTLVPGRVLHGRQGFWVLTPLRPSTGPAVAVVRGWVASREQAPPPQDGRIRVVGRVYPSEQQAPGQGTLGPPPDLPGLAARLPYPLGDGYVVATDGSTRPPGVLRRLPAEPWPSKAQGFPLQNAAYALQWWLFALFVVYMWWRVMRDQWRGRTPVPTSSGASVTTASDTASDQVGAPVSAPLDG